jgi:AbrB family looped-hinge helix DNA binding protein
MGTQSDSITVTVDDRGRVTLPKAVRERLHVDEGDDLTVAIEDGEIRLRSDKTPFEPITSNKTEWGAKTFLDTETAMVGEPDGEDTDGN